jgi:hypothetical protein
MLEGQVAVLNSGVLDPAQGLELMTSLFDSAMFREDQQSFMLYPARELAGFLEKNVVPASAVSANPLLAAIVAAGDESLICRDAGGEFRFCAKLPTIASVKSALEKLALADRWKPLVASQGQSVLDLYDDVFQHRSFTGRSGSMVAYEGIGCIYWHMVAKLLLAVQENFWRACDEGRPTKLIGAWAAMYYRVRAGLGFNKSAGEYGAFPTDPYSHTPAAGGARQPGMTGQVKEQIITRLGEWGVRVRDGRISFEPRLLRKCELLKSPTTFEYIDVSGAAKSIDLDRASAAFTFCQVPVIYQAGDRSRHIAVHSSSGSILHVEGMRLDSDASAQMFERHGSIARIDVGVDPAELLDR